MNFLRAIATVGGLTLLSRVGGFVRDILTAAILGAGPAADAFFVALKLPNFFRRLFAEGAFSVSFVPLFSAELEQRGRPAAIRFAEEAAAVMVAILIPFTLAMITAMPLVVMVIAPGFSDEPDKYALTVALTRLTFPYLMLISLVSLFGGVLNSLHRFGPFAAAPVAFNLTLIGALLLAQALHLDAAFALAYGVAVAGVVQLVWLAWACRRAGVVLRLPRPRLTPRIRRLFVLIAPGAFGAGAMQINLFVDIVLASLLPTGAVSYLYYADRLYQLPLSMIGIAIGTVLLPVLARRVAAGDSEGVRHYLSRALEFSLVLGLPASVALIIAAEPIIRVLFERGAFGSAETAATAGALAAYAIGIPAYVISKVLSAAYFARQDTAGPVKATLVVTVVNGLTAYALIHVLAHVGIALATGLTAWLQVGLLAWGLHRRGRLTVDHRLRRRTPRLLLAVVIMAGVLLVALVGLGPWFHDGSTVARGAALVALVATGGLAFLFSACLTGGLVPSELRAMLGRF